MPRSVGWTGERWKECALCGRPFPMSMLVPQRGFLVCKNRCLDSTATVDDPRATLVNPAEDPSTARLRDG